MRLKLQHPRTWSRQPSPNGPPTFCREKSTGVFQVSFAEYRGPEPPPQVSAEKLQQTATTFGQKSDFGELVEASNGPCRFGSFGTAIFRSATHARIQVWFATDGRDHILATHICSEAPEPAEIQEVQRMVQSLALGA